MKKAVYTYKVIIIYIYIWCLKMFNCYVKYIHNSLHFSMHPNCDWFLFIQLAPEHFGHLNRNGFPRFAIFRGFSCSLEGYKVLIHYPFWWYPPSEPTVSKIATCCFVSWLIRHSFFPSGENKLFFFKRHLETQIFGRLVRLNFFLVPVYQNNSG